MKSAQKEIEARKQLDKVRAEKDQMEAQLWKVTGTTALRMNELTNELNVTKKGQAMLQDSPSKQTVAVESIKRDLTTRMTDVTTEKRGLA